MTIPEEFSRFPDHWEVLPFSKAVKDATSGNVKVQKGDYLESGSIPIVDQGQSLYGGYTDEQSAICKSELPTIVFGDHTRTFKFIEERFVLGADGAKVLEPLENLDKRFLFHYLKQLRIESAGYSRHFKFLKETYVPVPPLAEQKRIAAILDKADALRRKRQQAIDLADQFLRSVFLDMFGDPVTNPKGWEDLSLGELIAAPLQNGAYYPKEHYVDSGVEMVHMSDAFYDVVQRGSLKRVAAPNKDVEKYALTEDDILISRRSLNLEGAAKPSLIPISDEPLIFESSMIRVTTDQSRLLPKYLFAFLSHPLVKTSRVFQYVTGATIKGISQSNLAKVQVLVPAIELQREFVGVMNCIDELKLKSLKSGLEIEQAFSSLSQQAFSGQL
ncbi:restriction endonuclease subunit S [Shewanella algae]|uniref:restriction endonuclease subunit S n=1 Tax=Shewanella algae TaxID=38313 RepID=UPI00313C49B8